MPVVGEGDRKKYPELTTDQVDVPVQSSSKVPYETPLSPAYPPQKVSPAVFAIVAPAFFACAITASTSAREATLCPSVNSVGPFSPWGRPASRAMLARGQSASFRPRSRSMKTTAPYSNGVPMIPPVFSPSPSR